MFLKTVLVINDFHLNDMTKPIQRKTTLKWTPDGELSSLDMTRIIELLANKELTECVLACDANKRSSEILFHLKDR